MAEEGPASPLKRRVPGATGAGPAPAERPVLPEALIAQMQAAVDAAHEAQGVAQAAGAAEPATNPPGAADALDDLAESYLAADPDLTAGYADDAEIDDPGPGHRWSSLRAATSGWDALHDDAAPGTGVKHQRAAWWDRRG